MDNILKDTLLREMEKRGIKIPTLSIETGIPQDRIYKWFKQNTQPKAKDTETLNAWIKGEIYSIKPVSKDDKDAKIESLQYENIQLRLERIEANLKESLSNQAVMMRQVAVVMRLAAERYAGNDRKKLQEELNKIDTMIASGFE